jgi:hypothetical protein
MLVSTFYACQFFLCLSATEIVLLMLVRVCGKLKIKFTQNSKRPPFSERSVRLEFFFSPNCILVLDYLSVLHTSRHTLLSITDLSIFVLLHTSLFVFFFHWKRLSIYIASKSIHSIRIFGWVSHFRMVFIHFRSTHLNEFLPTTGQGGNLFLPSKNSLSLNHDLTRWN